jgi:hypothetical protein
LHYYYKKSIPVDEIKKSIKKDEFLGSPFYIHPQKITFKQIYDYPEYKIESTNLVCAFLYQDEKTEKQADLVYPILQNLLLSYHKINFFYSQSLILKKILAKQYETIENLTENYAQSKWDNRSLLKLPQESLDYYKKLSFLEDQARLVEAHLINYKNFLEQIKQETGQEAPKFFADFEKETEFYLKQMKSNISFLSPGIPLYEKLMLSVRTQVSIDEVELAQILMGLGFGISIGQVFSQPTTKTLSLYIDKGQNQSSVTSLWCSAFLTIILSIVGYYLFSTKVYKWLKK